MLSGNISQTLDSLKGSSCGAAALIDTRSICFRSKLGIGDLLLSPGDVVFLQPA